MADTQLIDISDCTDAPLTKVVESTSTYSPNESNPQDPDDLLSLVDYGSHSFWEKRYMEMLRKGFYFVMIKRN